MSDEASVDVYNFSMSRKVSGTIVLFSGQTGMKEDYSFDADPSAQYRVAFGNLAGALAAEGLTKDDLVELTTYHVGNLPELFEEFAAAKHEFLGSHDTVWTAIGVSSLAQPDAIVEIRATAQA